MEPSIAKAEPVVLSNIICPNSFIPVIYSNSTTVSAYQQVLKRWFLNRNKHSYKWSLQEQFFLGKITLD